MTNPTPVAWMQGNIVGKMQFSAECSPLYSADQLLQARADALREAAEFFDAVSDRGEWVRSNLRRMADEIEGEKE